MKITLSRMGGILPVRKMASVDADIDQKELEELVEEIRPVNPSMARDATSYELKFGGKTFPVDPDKVRGKYKPVFDKLKENLKIVKS